jgi:hypothetical protein
MTAPDRKYGLALRHSVEALDATAIPAWAVVVPMTSPLGRPCCTSTIPVYVLEAPYAFRHLVGTTHDCHTNTLSRALGEVDLGTPCCTAVHRNDGWCCSHDPLATPAMHPPRRPFHTCAA